MRHDIIKLVESKQTTMKKKTRILYLLIPIWLLAGGAFQIVSLRLKAQTSVTSAYFCAPARSGNNCPENITVNKNDSFTVKIYNYTTGDRPVNALKLRYSFPSSLKFVRRSDSGTKFPNIGDESGNGYYIISRNRGNLGGTVGNLYVTSLTFKATAAVSNAQIKLIGVRETPPQSYAINYPNGTNLLSTWANFTFTAKQPATPKPPKPPKPPAPRPPSKPTPRPIVRTPAPTPTVRVPQRESRSSSSGLKISDFAISDIGYRSVTLSWKTSKPATSKVNYGESADDLYNQQESSKKTTDHKVVLPQDTLRAGSHYFARITSNDGSGPVTLDGEFETEFIPVVVKVLGSDGAPVEGALVYWGDVTGETGQDGMILLYLPEGDITLAAEKDGQTSELPTHINLPESKDAANQQIEMKLEPSSATDESESSGAPLWLTILLVLLFGGLIIFGWWFWKKRRQNNDFYTQSGSELPNWESYNTPPPPPTVAPPAAVDMHTEGGPQHYPSLSELVQKDLEAKHPEKSTWEEEPTDMFSVLDNPSTEVTKPAPKPHKHPADTTDKHKNAPSVSAHHKSHTPSHQPKPHKPEAVVDEKDHSLKISHDT